MITYDTRFVLGSSCAIVGPSCCGKTELTLQILGKAHLLFKSNPARIVWCYGEIAPTINSKALSIPISISKGLPNHDEILPKSIIVLDDLMLEIASDRGDIINLFTRIAHHKECFIIYISQNFFVQGKNSRTLTLNLHYLFLFRNVRDATIIDILSRQMYPRDSNFLKSAFHDAVTNTRIQPYGYLLIDFRASTDDKLRIRTDIFGENIVYINKTILDK